MTTPRLNGDECAVVTWEGPGEPVVIAVQGSAGEAVTLPLEPEGALALAQALITSAVLAIKGQDSQRELHRLRRACHGRGPR